jgi:hypothetical protein
MKLIALATAGLVAAAALAPVPAAAAPHGWRWKNVCTTKWVGHHKVSKCRKVHVRY